LQPPPIKGHRLTVNRDFTEAVAMPATVNHLMEGNRLH
jgi:hypothetical protein